MKALLPIVAAPREAPERARRNYFLPSPFSSFCPLLGAGGGGGVGETLNDRARVHLSLHVDVPGNGHTDAMVTSATVRGGGHAGRAGSGPGTRAGPGLRTPPSPHRAALPHFPPLVPSRSLRPDLPRPRCDHSPRPPPRTDTPSHLHPPVPRLLEKPPNIWESDRV